jgi:hypothetical protein
MLLTQALKFGLQLSAVFFGQLFCHAQPNLRTNS